MATTHQTQNQWYCKFCQKYYPKTTKEEYFKHLESCNQKLNEMFSKETETSNLNVASFTFGGKHAENLKEMIGQETSLLRNNAFISGSKDRKVSFNDCPNELEDNYLSKYGVGFSNKLDQHNSFLSSIIQLVWNMKHLKNYIMNEIILTDEPKNSLLINLKSLLSKYKAALASKGNKVSVIELGSFRAILAEMFKNRRKFMIDKPDDPMDFYFSLVNALHSHFTDSSSSEISDTNCQNKCYAHKALWYDIGKIEVCNTCGYKSKRLFSYHNYLFDIPIESILSMTNSTNVVDMNKSFKLKSGKVSQDLMTLSDIKEKMFSYYKRLMNSSKSCCPGARCDSHSTTKNLFIGNSPSYLMFNLTFNMNILNLDFLSGEMTPQCKKQNSNNSHNHNNSNMTNNTMITNITASKPSVNFNLNNLNKFMVSNGGGKSKVFTRIPAINILKTMMLIPRVFELSTLFDHSGKAKVFYEFSGLITTKNYLINSTFYKKKTSSSTSMWIYYEDNTVNSFASYFEVISFCLKNSLIPVGIMYQTIEDKYVDNDPEIGFEEMGILEKFASTLDNQGEIFSNRLRPIEEVYKEKSGEAINESDFLLGDDSISGKPKKGSSGNIITKLQNLESNGTSINNKNDFKEELFIKESENLLQYNKEYSICEGCFQKKEIINNERCIDCKSSNIKIKEMKETNELNHDRLVLDDLKAPDDSNTHNNSNRSNFSKQIQSNLQNNKLNDYSNSNNKEEITNSIPNSVMSKKADINLNNNNNNQTLLGIFTNIKKENNNSNSNSTKNNSIINPISVFPNNNFSTPQSKMINFNKNNFYGMEDNNNLINVAKHNNLNSDAKPNNRSNNFNINNNNSIVNNNNNSLKMNNPQLNKQQSCGSSNNINNNINLEDQILIREKSKINVQEAREAKNLNMPKQILKKKSSGLFGNNNNTQIQKQPIVIKHNSNHIKQDLVVNAVKNNELNTNPHIIKNNNNSNKAMDLEREWICEGCNNINSQIEYKCKACKKMNPSINKDFIIRKEVVNQNNVPSNNNRQLVNNNSKITGISNTVINQNASNNNNNNNINKIIERKASEKKIESNHQGKPSGNFKNMETSLKKQEIVANMVNMHKKESCICHISFDPSLLRNGLCKLCKRTIQIPQQNNINEEKRDNRQNQNLQESNFTFGGNIKRKNSKSPLNRKNTILSNVNSQHQNKHPHITNTSNNNINNNTVKQNEKRTGNNSNTLTKQQSRDITPTNTNKRVPIQSNNTAHNNNLHSNFFNQNNSKIISNNGNQMGNNPQLYNQLNAQNSKSLNHTVKKSPSINNVTPNSNMYMTITKKK